MTRFILLLIISLFCITTVQSQSQHMLFKNIPIDGALDSFVRKMEREGFTTTYSYQDGTVVVMKGPFIGQICEIYIIATNNTKTVWKVVAQLPQKKSWNTLKTDYFKLKELYTTKYGQPSDSFEFFSKPYYEGDGYELQALRKDKCNFVTFFTFQEGGITVKIGTDGNINLAYEDFINSEIDTKEKEDIITEDI